jgi:hypothetical protein
MFHVLSEEVTSLCKDSNVGLLFDLVKALSLECRETQLRQERDEGGDGERKG